MQTQQTYQRLENHQQIRMASQQQQNYVCVQPGELEVTPYSKKTAKILGWLQIALGCACIVAEIVYLKLASPGCDFPVRAGIWTGVFHVVSGLIGVMSGSRATKCRVVWFMVMSIISSIVAIIGFLIAITATVTIKVSDRTPDPDKSPEELSLSCYYTLNSEIPQIALIAVQFVQAIIAITSASVCCRGVCCGRTTVATTITTTTLPAGAPYPHVSGPAVATNTTAVYAQQQGGGYFFPGAGGAVPQQGYSPAAAAAPYYPAGPVAPQPQPGYPSSGAQPSAPAPEEGGGNSVLPSYEEAIAQKPAAY